MSKDKLPKTIVSSDAIQYEKEHWSSTGTFRKRPSPGWSHKSQDLTGGFGVAYSVVFCGLIGIKKSLSALNETKRTTIIREAILRVLHFSGVKPLGKKLKKLPKQIAEYIEEVADTALTQRNVNLIINSDKFLTSYETGKKMFSHPLNDVSFVATGVESTSDYIGYVSRDTTIPRACFVFNCLGNSQRIAITMTQAFEIKLKELLKRGNCNDLMSSQGMKNGGWGKEHIYNDGGGSWNNTSLPPVPAVFDDNIYAGIDHIPDALYDNNGACGSRGDQDIYDNRPGTNPISHSEQGIYDNSAGNLGRKEGGEDDYDNCPKIESEDYLEGLLKQNIYDNNLSEKLPPRVPDERIYDNNATSAPCESQSTFESHVYSNVNSNVQSVEENAYEIGETLYDNRGGASGDRELHEGVYDNNPIQSQEIVSQREDTPGTEDTPEFGESPYDNCTNEATPQVEDTYTSMESVNMSGGSGLYDNVSGQAEEREAGENVYDLAEDFKKLNKVSKLDSSIIISNDYDKLADIYDLPLDKSDNTEEVLQIYDNALPNEQTTKPPGHDLATELIYDNNRLLDPNGIELLGEVDDEFESNPVYGIPEDMLSPLISKTAGTGACLFSNQLTEPKILSPTQPSADFDDSAIYSGSLAMAVESESDSDIKILPINSLPFFHHLLSRKDSEVLLEKEGDFLIRESQSRKGQYVISGLYQGRYQHLLFLAKDGKIQTKEKEFPSISHLVAHYMKTKELLSTGINNISLITPISASFPDSDIYTLMK